MNPLLESFPTRRGMIGLTFGLGSAAVLGGLLSACAHTSGAVTSGSGGGNAAQVTLAQVQYWANELVDAAGVFVPQGEAAAGSALSPTTKTAINNALSAAKSVNGTLQTLTIPANGTTPLATAQGYVTTVIADVKLFLSDLNSYIPANVVSDINIALEVLQAFAAAAAIVVPLAVPNSLHNLAVSYRLKVGKGA